ncbi:hypothetical protein PRVXT_002411 [Proteinivorax tanatarense]|uniref:Uncharacterized protein n=1 Tax=Proteinivorax tanatarense TaxID=1260629 RepID=A0AAU7VK75_9FIRM
MHDIYNPGVPVLLKPVIAELVVFTATESLPRIPSELAKPTSGLVHISFEVAKTSNSELFDYL